MRDRERRYPGRVGGPEPALSRAGVSGRLRRHGQDGSRRPPRSSPRRAWHFHELDDPMSLNIAAQRTDPSKYALTRRALLVACILVLADCTPQAKVAISEAQIPAIAPGTARAWFFQRWHAPTG